MPAQSTLPPAEIRIFPLGDDAHHPTAPWRVQAGRKRL